MKISFSTQSFPKSGAIACGVMADRKLPPVSAELNKKTGNALRRAMKNSRFEGKKGQFLEVLMPPRLRASHGQLRP